MVFLLCISNYSPKYHFSYLNLQLNPLLTVLFDVTDSAIIEVLLHAKNNWSPTSLVTNFISLKLKTYNTRRYYNDYSNPKQ